jgi:hypothetical protein
MNNLEQANCSERVEGNSWWVNQQKLHFVL